MGRGEPATKFGFEAVGLEPDGKTGDAAKADGVMTVTVTVRPPIG